MSFERVVCWDPARVARVMEIEAEEASPPVFMAVHTDEPLVLSRPQGRRSTQEFLDEFLSADGDVRAVVIGDSGSGKSHLVHWVQLNVPSRPDVRVVSVPRSGTSLRWIVERLIEELPPSLQDDFRSRLVRVPRSATDFKELELLILSKIALALQSHAPRDDVDAALAGGLRDFLLDPALREVHTGKAGIVADLVRHITQPSGREERDVRRRFQEADLHLDHAMRNLTDLAAPTRWVLTSLQGNPEHRERAVELLNANLDEAVAQTLGLSGSVLTELLNEIRRHLGGRGQELVLLVEDLVRTEGIDRALINALIERGDDLCRLRLLIASTTGYFEREMLDTQKTRMDFIINLSARPPLDEENRLAPFTARYLNALRVDEETLTGWYDESRSGQINVPLPNACEECRHRPVCHTAFGASSIEGAGEVGLYPLTSEALANMAQRARERSLVDAQLDPRTLLRDILRPITGDLTARAIGQGVFPDEPLLERHGGARLPLAVQERVRSEAGMHAERHLALLELWGQHPSGAAQLASGIYRAFALEPPKGTDTTSPTPTVSADPEPTPDPLLPDSALITSVTLRRLSGIKVWANGGPMTGVTNDLRGLVFAAVSAAINWDGEGLEQPVFAGSRGAARDSFQRRNIDFIRQDTARSSRAVKLRLPLRDDPKSQLRAARALEGLVNFNHFRSWQFPDGPNQLRAVSHEIPLWAEHVVNRLRRVHDPEREWDPVASAIEVLAIGAGLASLPPQMDASITQRLAAALEKDWPETNELQVLSRDWRSLYRGIHRGQTELRELVLAHASAMKGGRSGSMLDAARIVGPLRALMRDWQPRAVPPKRLARANLPVRYRRTFDLHAQIRERLTEVVEDERLQRLKWLGNLRNDMPEGIARRAVVESLEQLATAIDTHGLPVQTDAIAEPLERFRAVQLDEAIRMTEDLRIVDGSANQLLPRLASARRGTAMQSAAQFLPQAQRFLDTVESRIQSEQVRATGSQSLSAQYTRIDTAFAELQVALESIVNP